MKTSQLWPLFTTGYQNKLAKVYNMSFKTVLQIHLHFANQPKSQHGVKATSFPRIFYVPPPPAADTIFNGSERFTRTPICKTRPMIGHYKSRPFRKNILKQNVYF